MAVTGEELTPFVVPDNDVALGAHERVAGTVVHDPQLHVGGVGHVPDVHRIHDQDAVVAECLQRLRRAIDAVLPHRRKVRQVESRSDPLRLERSARANREVMEITRRTRHFRRAVERLLHRPSDSSTHDLSPLAYARIRSASASQIQPSTRVAVFMSPMISICHGPSDSASAAGTYPMATDVSLWWA